MGNTDHVVYAHKALDVQYVTIQAAAEYTGLSRDTLRRRISTGELAAYRTGRNRNARILIRRVDLDAMLTRIPTVGGSAA